MALDRSELTRIAAEHWTKKTKEPYQGPTRWWHHPLIVRHVNESICGVPVDGEAAGDVGLLERRMPGRVFGRGISIGCGNGVKEVALLRAGLVSHFDLYEISEARIQQGQELADRHHLGSRITWHNRVVDFASRALDGRYDLVYWNSALHHMLDVDQAVKWSKRALRRGGYLYMNDFVGPNRMQWSDEALAIASRVRELLPRRLLKRPTGEGYLPTRVKRANPDKLAAADPTECADSADILPAIRRHFPAARIKPTGGIVYQLALQNVIANFTDDDTPLLEMLLLLDDVCTMAGHTHHAVALAPRRRRSARRKRAGPLGVEPLRAISRLRAVPDRLDLGARFGVHSCRSRPTALSPARGLYRHPGVTVNLTDIRDRSVRLVEGAALGLLSRRGYQLSPASSRVPEGSSPGPRFRLDKGELIDYAFGRCSPRPASFADLGGVWGVQGAYTFYALEAHRPRSAFLVDDKFTPEVIEKATGHPELQLMNGNFGTDSVASKVRGVDAILLFDVLLHQVDPDWDRILEMYTGTANYLLIYNQQWTGEKTVRLLDLGPEEYFRNTPREPTDRLYRDTLYQDLFEKMDELHPEHNRPWRDIYNVWQWGITDADLIATVEALGFRMQYYKNCGRFGELPNFENHAFVFKRAGLPT